MSERIALRPARSQDMLACARIINTWIDETDWLPRMQTPEAITAHYQTTVFQERRSFVVTADGMVIGVMSLSNDGYISAMCLGRQYRGRGVGTMMINQAKVEFGHEVKVWTFEANVLANAFFSKHGFFSINRTDGDNEEGLPDVLMQWFERVEE
jgi:ribosomal protein S18 acetylase RimI-like enzyme